jgi:hypothetical protein
VAKEESFTGFFRLKQSLNDQLNEFGVYLNLDFNELKNPYGDKARWEESVYNAVDGSFASREAIAKAPAIEVYKWFLLGAKRRQRIEDQKALMEYEEQVKDFRPGI